LSSVPLILTLRFESEAPACGPSLRHPVRRHGSARISFHRYPRTPRGAFSSTKSRGWSHLHATSAKTEIAPGRVKTIC